MKVYWTLCVLYRRYISYCLIYLMITSLLEKGSYCDGGVLAGAARNGVTEAGEFIFTFLLFSLLSSLLDEFQFGNFSGDLV